MPGPVGETFAVVDEDGSFDEYPPCCVQVSGCATPEGRMARLLGAVLTAGLNDGR